MARSINAQYNVVRPGSLPDRVAAHMRRKMYACFLSIGAEPQDTILDVGVTSDRTQIASNYLEAWYPHKERITACGLDDASFLEAQYPGMTFVRADGRDLPFGEGAYDYVHSSAVLEHVGSEANQLKFLSELLRVARRAVFVTTPNRWFPIEFHTTLPLLHWLPPDLFRGAARRLGHPELALESNLNLLDSSVLRRMCRVLGADSWRVGSVSLLGWPSNLLVELRKGRTVA
jgi:hypothetical protein